MTKPRPHIIPTPTHYSPKRVQLCQFRPWAPLLYSHLGIFFGDNGQQVGLTDHYFGVVISTLSAYSICKPTLCFSLTGQVNKSPSIVTLFSLVQKGKESPIVRSQGNKKVKISSRREMKSECDFSIYLFVYFEIHLYGLRVEINK